MPFADELRPVKVVPYDARWPEDFLEIAAELRTLGLGLGTQGAIDHIGSTAVPGLVAKDVIDVQVRVPALDRDGVAAAFTHAGYRRRPEPWNNVESTRTGDVAKLVFAGATHRRLCNIHVRVDGTTGATDGLLCRDCLRSEAGLRDTWSEFKTALADSVIEGDLLAYGRVKQPAWRVLMQTADTWAHQAGWVTPTIGEWPIYS